jgi:hypothetical protein
MNPLANEPITFQFLTKFAVTISEQPRMVARAKRSDSRREIGMGSVPFLGLAAAAPVHCSVLPLFPLGSRSFSTIKEVEKWNPESAETGTSFGRWLGMPWKLPTS